MGSKSQDLFLTVRSEGAILPPDLLQRIVAGDHELRGLAPDDYHLPKSEKINEATSRAWNRLLGVWAAFRAAIEKLPDTDAATTATRERWLQPFFQELGYGRLLSAKPIDVEGKSYAISHGWSRTPIHLLGCRVDLDRSAQRVSGASCSSPHSLLQEALNRSPNHLWGFVTNGFQLRVLRNNATLTRQAFVEFDLEAMMLGENYADYVLLWLLCHQSRVEAENPNDCWLEKWSQASKERGVRALDHLRLGVERAITALGRGFLSCPSNKVLRDRLRNGVLDPQDYYRQLLRLVYRLLFLFSAEDRGLLLLPGEENGHARARFLSYYSTTKLRRLAERRAGTRHTDLFATLRLVMARLGTDSGCIELALPALGSFLFSEQAIPDLEVCDIGNFDLSEAVRALAVTVSNGVRRSVDYKNLGAEEFGSVYESLLELHPHVNLDGATFELKTAGGSERKTTGSYYTPTSLIDCLLDSALDPVLDEAAHKPEPEQAILGLKIVDPACGSGHFLIAAAHRVAKRLASVRTGDEEPAPEFIRRALRDVIGHCIYGVDINPMAVELCKVNLWMEALEPGRPLSFLEHHIQCGNALLGTTPALLNTGIPDVAFTPLEGDDREACTKWKKVNKAERSSRTKKQARFDFDAPWMKLGKLAEGILAVDNLSDESIERIHEKERLYEQAVRSADYLDGRFLADAWCAAFVWKKNSLIQYPITEDIFREIEQNPVAFHNDKRVMTVEVQRLAREYQFLHWHLSFPDVFLPAPAVDGAGQTPTGWNGGFDIVLGNPPWERVKIQEKEWFAGRDPEIANAPHASARKRLIEILKTNNSLLYQSFLDDSRKAEGESHLIRNGGRYPLCGRGDINLYPVFAECMRTLLNDEGRVGCVLPSGIATDDTTKFFFQEVVDRQSLVSLFSFENEEFVFPAVHHATRFCLFTVGSGIRATADEADFVFFARQVKDLAERERHFALSSEDIIALNPNTRTCPIFRSKRDAELTKAIHRRSAVLIRDAAQDKPAENPWGITFCSMFHMSNDSHRFQTAEHLGGEGYVAAGNIFRKDGEEYLPLYEAKMIHHFDHRWGTYEGQTEAQANQGKLPELDEAAHSDPEFVVIPKYWVNNNDIDDQLGVKWERKWLLGFRSIARATDQRTVISAVLPRSAVSGKLPLLLSNRPARDVACLLANLCSLILDYAARQKVGGTDIALFIAKQFPILSPEILGVDTPWSRGIKLSDWILPRTLELTYTAWDIAAFADDCESSGPPFCWHEERRFLLRCELDAAFFHTYLGGEDVWRQQPRAIRDAFQSPREAVTHILDTFPILSRKDEQRFGEYRTKRVILEIYDAITKAELDGTSYQTRLDPPPADPRVAHAAKQPVAVASRRISVADLTHLPAAAWATPELVAADNLALFALIDVVRAFNGRAKPFDVRSAAILVRNPSMALAFLDQPHAKEWVRVIGADARPLLTNVVSISQFQHNSSDLPWSKAISQLAGSGALQTGADHWIAAAKFPVSSGQDWVAGRAEIAVELVLTVLAAQFDERLAAFLGSVADGTAIRNVS